LAPGLPCSTPLFVGRAAAAIAPDHLDEDSFMANSAPPSLPPLIDNPFADEFFADEATGFMSTKEHQHHVLLGSGRS
jgi:hypothetical protein